MIIFVLRKLAILIIILLSGIHGLAVPKHKLDSLYKKLSATAIDSVRANINFRIAYYYYYNDQPDSAYAHFRQSYVIAEKCNSKLWIKKSAKELGFYFTEISEIDSSAKYFHKAIAAIEKEEAQDFEIFSGIGNVYFFRGDYIKAYEYYLKFLKLAELEKKPSLISRAYSCVGIALKEQKKTNESLVFLKKSLDIAEKNHLPHNTYVALVNIGNLYSEKYIKERSKYNYEMTILYYIKARDLIDSVPKNKLNQSSVILLYGNIGNTYADAKEYDKALAEYNKGLKLLEEIESFESVSLFYNNLASVYIDMHNASMGKKYLDLAHKAAVEVSGSSDDLRQNYGTTASYYELVNDYKKAYQYHVRFKSLSDSLFSTENAEKRKEIELNSEFEKKEAEAKAIQEKKELIAEEEKKKQQIVLYALGGGFILMLLVAFLIFRGYRQKQKANEIITQQKLEVEKQKELVEEKQKEIVDSIRYAKRIQQSLMPTQKYIEKRMENLKNKS